MGRNEGRKVGRKEGSILRGRKEGIQERHTRRE
jgi:hypothetical protein